EVLYLLISLSLSLIYSTCARLITPFTSFYYQFVTWVRTQVHVYIVLDRRLLRPPGGGGSSRLATGPSSRLPSTSGPSLCYRFVKGRGAPPAPLTTESAGSGCIMR